MFKIKLAQYINENMVKHNLTYKDIAIRASVPPTTLSYYARGQVTTPNDDYCTRIAAVFGDPPEVIQQMRRDSLSSTATENKLIAGADDTERMERFAELLRSNMLAVMEEHRAASAEQQTEIINHADNRVVEERIRASELNAKVLKQCTEEIEREKNHNAELLAAKDSMIDMINSERDKVRTYLKRIIRNLSIALIAVTLLSVLGLSALGGYAFYAYHTFDRTDPTRGIYRETPSPIPEASQLPIE